MWLGTKQSDPDLDRKLGSAGDSIEIAKAVVFSASADSFARSNPSFTTPPQFDSDVTIQ